MKRVSEKMSSSVSRRFPPPRDPKDLQTFMVRIYLVREARGMKRKEFFSEVREAGYAVSENYFMSLVKRMRASPAKEIWPEKKKGGRSKAMTSDMLEICAGWILHKNEAGEEVHLKDYRDFVQQSFSITISDSMASRYLKESGMALKTTKKGGKAAGVDKETQAWLIWDWVLRMRSAGVFSYPRSKMASIDFTYTSHRSDSKKTFSAVGSLQPTSSCRISHYTNAIVTCVWADGVNRNSVNIIHLQPEIPNRPSRHPKETGAEREATRDT